MSEDNKLEVPSFGAMQMPESNPEGNPKGKKAKKADKADKAEKKFDTGILDISEVKDEPPAEVVEVAPEPALKIIAPKRAGVVRATEPSERTLLELAAGAKALEKYKSRKRD